MQRFKRFFNLNFAAVEFTHGALQGGDPFLHLCKAILELRCGRRDIRAGQLHSGKRFIDFRKARIHLAQRGLCL